MVNFYCITKEVIKEQNPSYLKIPDDTEYY